MCVHLPLFPRFVPATYSASGGKWHSTTYRAKGVQDEVLVDLDTMDHLKSVTCDLDGSKLRLKFSSDVWAAEYFVRFHDWNDHFLVGASQA